VIYGGGDFYGREVDGGGFDVLGLYSLKFWGIFEGSVVYY
jgi:hypothetical protein